MEDREDPKNKLVRLVRSATSNPARKRAQSVRIEGSHNIVGDGNTVIHVPVVRPRNLIDASKSELTEAQKLRLRELLHAWVDAHNTIRTKAAPLSYPAAWSSFQRKFRVTSYHLLPASRYDEACSWLLQRRAIIDGMKTAPAKDPKWRARQIASIHARCKSHFAGEPIYRAYIVKQFGVASLTELTDEQLHRTRAWLFRKKQV